VPRSRFRGSIRGGQQGTREKGSGAFYEGVISSHNGTNSGRIKKGTGDFAGPNLLKRCLVNLLDW
jgi:hypothetical protein